MNNQYPMVNRIKPGLRPSAAGWIALLVLAAGFFANAQSTDDSNTTDFSSFQVIAQRNIFDPNRYPHESRNRPRREGTPTFSLAGTMSYRKGMFAFFDGTSPDYQKTLQEGGTIAGYTVSKITFDGAKLQSNGKEIALKVGSAMRQQGDGWELSDSSDWGKSSSTDTSTEDQSASQPSTDTLPGGGAANDTLKRLMEQRQQLMQNK